MQKNISITSLGCSKNLVDAEHMLGILTKSGYNIVTDEADADIIIINTCTFIEAANSESIETILELSEYKKSGRCKFLIVTGCMAERYREQVLSEIPEVDAVIGTSDYPHIADIIDRLIGGEMAVLCFDGICEEKNLPRIRTTPEYTAFLKIAEGCDNFCTYCVIPSVRGRYVSREFDEIIEEAERFAKEGVKELVVIAQDTGRYGKDLYGEYRLPELLSRLCRIDGICWVRVHYCYPELVTDELISVFKEEKKLCNYFDIPIQHCNDGILKRMNRHTNKAQIKENIGKIRAEIPEAVIRTSLIVGFPGETDDDFEELCDFVREMKFERLGVFTYSREEDTPAYKLDGQLDEEIKEKRRDLIMLIQSEISENLNDAKIDTVQTVLVEGKDEIIKSFYGRTYADSEEVDGKVFFKSDRDIKSGEFVSVLIEQALEYDIFGKEVPTK